MGLFGNLKSGLQSAGRFIGSTGKGALQALGQGVKEVRRIGGVVNSATGGAAGKVFEMSKSLPGIGAVSASGRERSCSRWFHTNLLSIDDIALRC